MTEQAIPDSVPAKKDGPVNRYDFVLLPPFKILRVI